jgi:hypothetical protein
MMRFTASSMSCSRFCLRWNGSALVHRESSTLDALAQRVIDV